ncbi:phenylacetate--CoA ligase family protein [Deefgea rivuli]|uniref:phenylacetate--CoA ligase family protein n=1 Tax=Deefgea rivuli TaxID=400948 RepID=UPI000480F4C3|nr:phenylacetate--CoA ligase family protein [Deefgea rivuli]
MTCLAEIRFKLVDLLRGTATLPLFLELSKLQFDTIDLMKNRHSTILKKHLVLAASRAIAYTNNTGNELGDWPIVAKDAIRQKPAAYLNRSYTGKIFNKKTSGSTGAPFQYKTSEQAQSYLWAGILLAWSAAGYRLGDRVAMLAGGALFSSSWKHQLFYSLMNVQPLSTMGMDDALLQQHCVLLARQKIKFVYGYANALHLLALYIERHPMALNGHTLTAVISTAENLSATARADIERILGVSVFNQYGCNDAGLSAFECEQHQGLHIIAERCFAETLPDGRLIATDMANIASFFIRYETGDLAEIDHTPCACGRSWPRITQIHGRSNDLLIDMQQKRFPAAYFTQLFAYTDIKAYQILFTKDAVRIIYDNGAQTLDKAPLIKQIKNDMQFLHYEICEGEFLVQNNGKRRYVLAVESLS